MVTRVCTSVKSCRIVKQSTCIIQDYWEIARTILNRDNSMWSRHRYRRLAEVQMLGGTKEPGPA